MCGIRSMQYINVSQVWHLECPKVKYKQVNNKLNKKGLRDPLT